VTVPPRRVRGPASSVPKPGREHYHPPRSGEPAREGRGAITAAIG
jgi:hypothetical protein